MKLKIALLFAALAFFPCAAFVQDARFETNLFTNGDINGDGMLNVTDAVALLEWQFSGGPAPVTATCSFVEDPGGMHWDSTVKNGDVNGDGNVDISDAVALLTWMFSGGAAPAEFNCAGG